MKLDEFDERIQNMHQRVAQMQQHAGESPSQQQQLEIMATAFQELSTALEELQVANEELHASNERLSATCKAVEAERQHYQELFEFAPEAYLLTDTNGVIQEANRAAATLLNISQTFLVGQALDIYVVKNERPAFYSRMTELFQADKVQEWEIGLQPLNNTLIASAVKVAAVRNQQNQIVGLHWLLRDITECKRIKLELQQANERFKLAATAVNCLIYDWDINTKTVDRTQGLENVLGYRPEEAEPTLDWWSDRIHPDDQRRVLKEISDALATRSHYTIEYRMRHKNDQYLYVWDKGLIIRDMAGQAVRVVGSDLDITPRKQAQKAQRESEALLRTVIANAPIVLYALDREGVFTLSEGKGLEPAGLKPGQLVGQSVFELYQHQSHIFEQLRLVFAGTEGHWIAETNDVVYENRATPLRDEKGQLIGLIGIATDITERKRTDAAPQESEQQLQAIMDNSPAAVYLKDLQCRYLMVNRQYEKNLRRDKVQIIGKTDYDFFSPETANQLIADDQEVLANPTLLVLEDEMLLEDGLHTYMTIKFPLFDAKGVLYAICGISTDITKRKRAEKDLQRLNEELENRVRERTTELEQLNELLIVEVALRARAEASLRNREQEFRALVENAPDVIQRFDRELRHVYVNPAVEKITGSAPREFIGKTNRELDMSEPSLSLWEGVLKKIFETGHEEQIEFSRVTPNGLRYYQTRFVPEFGADGEGSSGGTPVSVLGISRDVTERKLALEALRESEQRFRQLTENIHEVFWMASLDPYKIIYISPGYEQIWGYTCESLYTDPFSWQKAIHPKDRDRVLASFEKQELGEFDEEFRIVQPDGSIRWIRDRSFPVHDEQGRVYRVAGIAEEITERKLALEALRESEQRFRQLAENIHDVFWITSPGNTQTIYVSPGYEKIWGRTCESVYQQPLSWLEAVHPEDRERVCTCLKELIQKEYEQEYRIVRPDGSIRWIRARCFPVHDQQGRVYRLARITEDITYHKQAELETYKMLQKERELGELKSRFISMTSHEFRTPLTTIQSSSELLERYRERLSQEKLITHLHRIQTAVERMTQMLDDILLIGKAESGKLEFQPTRLDLVQLCRELVDELQQGAGQQHAIALTHRGALRAQYSERAIYFTSMCPCFPTNIDEKLLRHILGNLLSNAIKYSPGSSSVQLDLTCLDGKAIFTIQDQGIGIPEEDLPRLFEAFHRATNVGTIQGTGLGLAIVKECVELHKGEITVKSEVGKGTTFTVTLPLSN